MKEIREDVRGFREPMYEIDPLFVNRWSPRALGTDMSKEDLMACFEAARWAPSSYNNQSWRFMYATHEDEEWDTLHSLVNEFNQKWASDSYALIVVASKTTFDHNGEESITHSFDTGSAWENFALEAAKRDLAAHGMQGIHYEKAREELDIPEDFEVEMMIAIGSKEDETQLPEDMQAQPNGRKDMKEIVTKGNYDF